MFIFLTLDLFWNKKITMNKTSWLSMVWQFIGRGEDGVGVWMKTQILIHYLGPRNPRWDARPFQWQQHLVHTVQSISLIGNPFTWRRRSSHFNYQSSILYYLMLYLCDWKEDSQVAIHPDFWKSMWLEMSRSSDCIPLPLIAAKNVVNMGGGGWRIGNTCLAFPLIVLV